MDAPTPNTAPAWLTDPVCQARIARRAHDRWERDLAQAFLHLTHGIGPAPKKPVDFSTHPVFAFLHARWQAHQQPANETR